MTESVSFNIAEKAIGKIIELREQEPGDSDYALFLQIDGMQGNQFTYDLSFLDVKEAREDDVQLQFGKLPVIIAAKDKDNFDGASLNLSEDLKRAKYAGIEPIKRALQNHEERIAVCCHHITKNFDEGEVIFKSYHDTNYDEEKSLDQNIERLKNEITKYFPELTIKTLEYLIDNDRNEK